MVFTILDIESSRRDCHRRRRCRFRSSWSKLKLDRSSNFFFHSTHSLSFQFSLVQIQYVQFSCSNTIAYRHTDTVPHLFRMNFPVFFIAFIFTVFKIANKLWPTWHNRTTPNTHRQQNIHNDRNGLRSFSLTLTYVTKSKIICIWWDSYYCSKKNTKSATMAYKILHIEFPYEHIYHKKKCWQKSFNQNERIKWNENGWNCAFQTWLSRIYQIFTWNENFLHRKDTNSSHFPVEIESKSQRWPAGWLVGWISGFIRIFHSYAKYIFTVIFVLHGCICYCRHYNEPSSFYSIFLILVLV